MLFPEGPAELRRAWRAIAAATAAGGLGCSAKAATGGGAQTLICVYAPDFRDRTAVCRGPVGACHYRPI